MEYIYSALLLHKIGKEVNEMNVKHVLQGAGAHVDDAKLKALVTSLDGVNIEEAIKESAMPVAVAHVQEAKKEEVKEEVKVDESKAAAGLGSLFS